jgi:hypothetical protein
VNGRSGDNSGMVAAMLKKRPPLGERCDFCAEPIPAEHQHLIELAARRIMCSCRPCHLVFEPAGAAQNKYRAIPTRYREVPDFLVEEATWEALQLPIGLAFFFFNSLEDKMVAFYPSPAGATESLLSLDTWAQIVTRFPDLARIEADVEAVIVQRNRETSRAFIVPIDSAYELVGIIRSTWKGFDGGSEAHAKIAEYFERLRARSQPTTAARVS